VYPFWFLLLVPPGHLQGNVFRVQQTVCPSCSLLFLRPGRVGSNAGKFHFSMVSHHNLFPDLLLGLALRLSHHKGQPAHLRNAAKPRPEVE